MWRGRGWRGESLERLVDVISLFAILIDASKELRVVVCGIQIELQAP